MSRFTLKPRSDQFTVVVGFDRPLDYLFGEVYDREDESDHHAVIWQSYPTLDALATAIAPYARLPREIREQLAAESGELTRNAAPIKRKEQVLVHGRHCSVVQQAHPKGGTILTLYSGGDEPYAQPTAFIPGVNLARDETLLKDYSEHTGMLEALVEAGIVVPTGRSVPSGYVELHVVRVTEAVP